MQIKFTPKRIRASKGYISNLLEEEKRHNELRKRASKGSFFRKIFNFLFR